MECLRAQPIQRERAIEQAVSAVNQASSPHAINIMRPEFLTVFSLLTHEQQEDISLLSQWLKYAIIETVREWGASPMHLMPGIMENHDMDRRKRNLLKLLGSFMGKSTQQFVSITRGGHLQLFVAGSFR